MAGTRDPGGVALVPDTFLPPGVEKDTMPVKIHMF